MRVPEVELLWWEGCPSTEQALSELRNALRDVGLAHADLRMREIRTDDDARRVGFRGSPTILIDGSDLAGVAQASEEAAPAGEVRAGDEPVGLSCRVYHRRDGTISATPDRDDLREALRRAATRDEVRR